jgi:hypothetical protein
VTRSVVVQPGAVHSVAFLPASPMLVPAVSAGAASELDEVRAACDAALDRAAAVELDAVVVLGGPTTGAGARGSARGFGVDWSVPLHPDVPEDGTRLSWEQAVGAHLLGARRRELPRFTAIPADGRRLMLVAVGDGSARRSDKAPGALDLRAEGFDAAVAAALAGGDLGDLDADLGAELMVGGLAVWQQVARLPGPWKGRLHCHRAPHGVGLMVASWLR